MGMEFDPFFRVCETKDRVARRNVSAPAAGGYGSSNIYITRYPFLPITVPRYLKNFDLFVCVPASVYSFRMTLICWTRRISLTPWGSSGPVLRRGNVGERGGMPVKNV